MGLKKKERADLLLVQQGLAGNQAEAQKLILAGKVMLGDQACLKPGDLVPREGKLTLRDGLKYVGRGALKLKAALEAFPINIEGLVCADVGCSTGGFTQVLLEHGASRVIAIDTAQGDFAWSLRTDPRVLLLERTNVLNLEQPPQHVDFACIDVSLLPLHKVLPVVGSWLSPGASIVALLKPQYEAQRDELPPGAVITDPEVHRRILCDVTAWCGNFGFEVRGQLPSPVTGMSGNQEFLLWLVVNKTKTTK
ncbi:MAG: TlyA family RNA methyltransferase [Oligoflexia bacterium]|nr:TlyA family RNA methyltransferase [Oligoflexia bacterium]